MRAVRLLLLLLGAVAAAYGGWLLYPQLDTTLPWLAGGPLLHDALVAPLLALAGLTLGRLVTDQVQRAWITAGLVTTATLVLIAVPLTWRPAHAPPNPGLQDRDYLLELTTGLAVLWTVIMIILLGQAQLARAGSALCRARPCGSTRPCVRNSRAGSWLCRQRCRVSRPGRHGRLL